MYFVELSQNADKFLNKLEDSLKERIKKTLKRLEQNPVPSDTRFIGRDNNDKVFRYRIGDYRALYLIDESRKIVLITKIDKRHRVYN